MKKSITLISVLLFLITIVSFTSVSAEEQITFENIGTTYLDEIDFNYHDLDLTSILMMCMI